MANGDLKCANCVHFQDGRCDKFDVDVDPDYICDAWEGDGERNPEKIVADQDFTLYDVEES